jgi:hypothetical protein
MSREKPHLLFHAHRQQTSRRKTRIYPINLMSQYSSNLGQVRSYKHVKPQQDSQSQHLKTIIHHDKCAPPSAVIISGVPRGTCSVPSLSFRATLFCSKLRMPSRPHRDIITLSCETKVIESTLHMIRRTHLIPRRAYTRSNQHLISSKAKMGINSQGVVNI